MSVLDILVIGFTVNLGKFSFSSLWPEIRLPIMGLIKLFLSLVSFCARTTGLSLNLTISEVTSFYVFGYFEAYNYLILRNIFHSNFFSFFSLLHVSVSFKSYTLSGKKLAINLILSSPKVSLNLYFILPCKIKFSMSSRSTSQCHYHHCRVLSLYYIILLGSKIAGQEKERNLSV